MERFVQTRRPTDMPGGLLVTALVFVSSGGFPCSEQTIIIFGESRRAEIGVALRECNYSYVASGAQGNNDNVNKPYVNG